MRRLGLLQWRGYLHRKIGAVCGKTHHEVRDMFVLALHLGTARHSESSALVNYVILFRVPAITRESKGLSRTYYPMRIVLATAPICPASFPCLCRAPAAMPWKRQSVRDESCAL